MEKEIFDFTSATFGISAAVTLVVVGVAIWLTQFVTRKVTQFRCEHDAMKEKHDEHDRKVRDMDADLSF